MLIDSIYILIIILNPIQIHNLQFNICYCDLNLLFPKSYHYYQPRSLHSTQSAVQPNVTWVIRVTTVPVHCVVSIQNLQDLLSALLLVLRVTSQIVEDPRYSTSCGVMAFKHECVHFSPDIFIRQTLLMLVLWATTKISEKINDRWYKGTMQYVTNLIDFH